MNKEKMIREYKDEQTGERYFRCSIDLRSEKIPSLRLRRQGPKLKTFTEAERSWPKFYQESIKELMEKEAKGESFESLLEAHELAIRRGETLEQLTMQTLNERISILRDWGADFLRKPAKEVSPYDVLQAMRKLREAGRSHSRANNFKAALNKVYKWGIATGYLQGLLQSPASGISLPREKNKKQEILTEPEMKRLLSMAKELNHAWYPVWAMALLTGMRNGELYALQWSDVDLEKMMLSVTKSYNAHIKGIKSTKSGKWRSVPINQDLVQLLAELRVQTGETGYVLPRIKGWQASNQAQVLKRMCIGVGLPTITFHTLRACFATNLMRKGVVPAQVMRICGWENLETMERYIRLAGIDIKGATDEIKLLPETEIMGKVVSLDSFRKG